MDKWEVELFDEKSAGDVALELHTARLEAEKLEQTVWTVHSEAARLKRLYEEAEKKSENVGYEVQTSVFVRSNSTSTRGLVSNGVVR